MLNEYLLKKAADIVFAKANDLLRDAGSGGAVKIETEQVESALNHHATEVRNWCESVSFSDLRGSRLMDDVFVPLSVYLQPRRLRLVESDGGPAVPIDSIFTNEPRHFVVLGQPGAGKTTSMKYVCRRVLNDEDFLPEIQVALVVRLRDLNRRPVIDGESQSVLLPHIEKTLGLHIYFTNEKLARSSGLNIDAVHCRLATEYLNSLAPLIVLDGFDEIQSKAARDLVIEEVRSLAGHLDRGRILLTSRTGEFTYHLDNVPEYEISPLSDLQISEFSRRWLGADAGASFVSQLRRSPYLDTAIRPLTLAHLCAIYERIGSVPERPKTIYRKIVGLLLEDWDQQRSVVRRSAYAEFEIDRKAEFLANLAYVLTLTAKGSVFTRHDLMSAYSTIHDNFGLPKGDASKVVSELESHTGLFIQAGFDSYEFSHKSLQEYLTAEYLVKLPAIPKSATIINLLPAELAVATSISSRSGEYLAQLMLERLMRSNTSFSFIRPFANRILIERVDFDLSSRAGMGLLTLISEYTSHVLNLTSVNKSSFIADIYPMIPITQRRLRRSYLLDVYDVHERFTTPGLETVRLTRKKQYGSWAKDDVRREMYDCLPGGLLLPSSLLDYRDYD